MKNFSLFTILQVLWVSTLHAEFGMPFIVNQSASVIIDQPLSRHAFRFTAPEDSNLSAVALHCADSRSELPVLVSLWSDKKGKPSQLLAEASYTPKAQSWTVLNLDQDSIPLVQGNSYYIIMKWD